MGLQEYSFALDHIMKTFCLFSVVLIFSPYARAQKAQFAQKPQEVTFSQLSAQDLIGLCKPVDAGVHSDLSQLCLMYLTGFTDGYNIAMARFNHEKQSAFCPPNEVTREQMAKVIVKYGADHPNLLWAGAPLFVAASLKDSYPCQE